MAKSRIQSVLTALPVLMLIIGLYSYYRGERRQLEGTVLLAESVLVDGKYKGMSEVRSGGQGQHFFWLISDGSSRAGRLTAEEAWGLETLPEPLQAGDQVSVRMAPTVSGSKTLWVVELVRNGKPIFVRK